MSVGASRYFGFKARVVPMVYFDITDKCNSACISCGIWRRKPATVPELSLEEIRELAVMLRGLKTTLISIAGAEPTLRADLAECISAFKSNGMAVKVNSNGLAIDRNLAGTLADSGLSIIYFSLDHPTRKGYQAIRGVDGFHRVLASVEHFRALPNPIPVGINIAISKMNQDVLLELADLCIRLGVQKVQFTPVHSHLQHRNMSEQVFKQLYPTDMELVKRTVREAVQRLRKSGILTNSDMFINNMEMAYKPGRIVPCMSGFLYMIISPFGEVMPCYQYPTGMNIRDKNLAEILTSETMQQHRRKVVRCARPCLDIGSAGPNIRFYPPYALFHLYECYQQMRLHI